MTFSDHTIASPALDRFLHHLRHGDTLAAKNFEAYLVRHGMRPLEALDAICDSFWRAGQYKALAQYMERYAAGLDTLARQLYQLDSKIGTSKIPAAHRSATNQLRAVVTEVAQEFSVRATVAERMVHWCYLAAGDFKHAFLSYAKFQGRDTERLDPKLLMTSLRFWPKQKDYRGKHRLEDPYAFQQVFLFAFTDYKGTRTDSPEFNELLVKGYLRLDPLSLPEGEEYLLGPNLPPFPSEIPSRLRVYKESGEKKRLRARWDAEYAQDLNAYQAMNQESEHALAHELAQNIAAEIDAQIIMDLMTAQQASPDVPNLDFDDAPAILAAYNQMIAEMGVPASYMAEQDNHATNAAREAGRRAGEALADELFGHRHDLRPQRKWKLKVENMDGDVEYIDASFAHASEFNTNPCGEVALNTVTPRATLTERYGVPLQGRRGESLLEAGFVWAPNVPLQVTSGILYPKLLWAVFALGETNYPFDPQEKRQKVSDLAVDPRITIQTVIRFDLEALSDRMIADLEGMHRLLPEAFTRMVEHPGPIGYQTNVTHHGASPVASCFNESHNCVSPQA